MNGKNNKENNKITEKDFEKELRLNQLYLSIISKYKEYIEEKEQKSISDLSSLITPQNEFIISKADAIKKNFLNYDYNKDFYDAASSAFDFVDREIDNIIMPVKYWLIPEETILFRLGDMFDKNILLVSLLIALGNHSSKVLLVINNSNEETFSYCNYENQILFFNFRKRISRCKTLNKCLDSLDLSIDQNTTIYEFNNLGVSAVNYP